MLEQDFTDESPPWIPWRCFFFFILFNSSSSTFAIFFFFATTHKRMFETNLQCEIYYFVCAMNIVTVTLMATGLKRVPLDELFTRKYVYIYVCVCLFICAIGLAKAQSFIWWLRPNSIWMRWTDRVENEHKIKNDSNLNSHQYETKRLFQNIRI